MSKFKQNDRVIITHPSRAGQRGRITGVFSGGYGVRIDGTGRGRTFYYDVDMEHEPGNPPVPQEEEAMQSWQTPDREPLKFELHELVRVCNTDSEYYDQAGHVRSIRRIAPEMFAYIVEFEGENGMPEFGSGELAKVKTEPSETYSIHQDGMEASAQSFVDRVREAQNQIHASYPHGEPYTAGKREDRPAEMKKFRTDDPLMQARKTVHFLFYNDIGLPIDDVYVVWFCSAVKNWKALVSTNVLDNCYYEVTHNGENNETYVDRYVKEINVKVRPDGVADFTLVNDFGRIY